MTNSPKLDMIGVVVRSLGPAVTFYRKLGLDLPDPQEGDGHIEAQLESGLRFALDTIETVKSFDPEWEEPTGSSRVGIAFLYASSEEVDAAFEELVAAGGSPHKQPWDAFWGQRYSQVRDPDGNVVDLFAWLETPESD